MFEQIALRFHHMIGRSTSCRIATGPRAGHKPFTLRTVPPPRAVLEVDPNGAALARKLRKNEAAQRREREARKPPRRLPQTV
jgi:hypothetical protein